MLTERWRAHPENAAAGLWTTADDLGRFLAALTASLSGVNETLLPADWARRMVTGVKPADRGVQIGHGLFINDEGTEFWHGGVNVGTTPSSLAPSTAASPSPSSPTPTPAASPSPPRSLTPSPSRWVGDSQLSCPEAASVAPAIESWEQYRSAWHLVDDFSKLRRRGPSSRSP